MRMGSPQKKRRGRRGKNTSPTPQNIPKFSSPGLLVGQVSSDVIASIYAPTIVHKADEMLEAYAGDLFDYQDLIKEQEGQAEVDADGNVILDDDLPPPPTRPLFATQASIDDFADTLNEISKHFGSETNGWKVHAHAAKFERQLDEKYGVFRPFITNHPEIENGIRALQRKYAMGHFSPFRRGDSPFGTTTSIVLLFMMQRNGVRWEALLLSFLFLLVGLQPWALVVLVALVHSQLEKRKHTTVGNMPRVIEPVKPFYQQDSKMETSVEEKWAMLSKPVGTKLAEGEKLDGSAYDAIVLGSGTGTLYTAALLARAGRKVLVLSGNVDASGCLTMSTSPRFAGIPFDAASSNVSRLNKIQSLLAPALVTTTDVQGGIRFAEIGSETDGYAFEILSIPGMGCRDGKGAEPFVLRAGGGIGSLMDDTATHLGDGWPGNDGDIGHSTSGAYMAVCAAINASASDFYMSKMLPEKVNSMRSASTYQDMSLRYASALLDRYFSLNGHVRSLMAGIGLKGESLKPSKTSVAAHVTNICSAFSGEGMHYPVGGPRSLGHALASVIEQCGGRVVTGVNIRELVFEPDPPKDETKPRTNSGESNENEIPAPRCIGVNLVDGQVVALPQQQQDDQEGAVEPTLVSMEGFIQTFIRWLPEPIRSKHKVPRGLPALTESRPVFKILFGIKGSAQDLNVTGADFYRLPQASLAIDEIDSVTGAVKLGVVGGFDDDDDDESDDKDSIAQNAGDGKRRDKTSKKQIDETVETTTTDRPAAVAKRTKARRNKFDTGVSWMQISFPSAKDPAFASCYGKDLTTCVVTIEADDDFVAFFDTKPKLYVDKSSDAGTRERLLERVKNDIFEIFPQLEGKIEQVELHGPFHRGLSHNPERYAAKGVRADSPYPGLFLGGSDLTVGESFSGSIVGGWLAANAVMGYSMVDHLYLDKNITSDLERFLVDAPPLLEQEDLAVPFTCLET